MSYILDALRKSEQQRQAVQPESVTERLLQNPAQPKQKLNTWIAVLMISNLLAIGYVAWFFMQKTAPTPQTYRSTSLQKALVPSPSTQPISITAKATPALPKPVKPDLPSIAQLVEAKKITPTPAPKPTVKPAANKEITEKKPRVAKKEPTDRSEASQTQQPEFADLNTENQESQPVSKDTHELNDLPYTTRNNLPNLTINVFSYAQQPQDRFVIINMVKYRAGQLIKGGAILKEIRPDSILVQYGNDTVKIDRP